MTSTGAVVPFPADEEYVKNRDISREDIAKLRQWLETQPHLPGDKITDLDLLITYHCCDLSAEVSKQVLDLHFTLRTLFDNFFKDRSLDRKVQNCLDTILYAPLPKPTVFGYRAIYCRLMDPDPRLFIFADVIRTFMMVFDLWATEEGTWPGFVLMIDMDQAQLGHIAKLDLMSVRQTLYFLQEAMLVRLKEVHFLNAPFFMDKLMMILKPFMKKELLDMISIHQSGAESIYNYVPKEAFPKESGGEHTGYKTIQEDTIKRFQNNTKYFMEENKRRVTESQRPGGKAPTVETLFGIQGSFKKLDID